MEELAKRIYEFLETYAAIRPDWDKNYDDETNYCYLFTYILCYNLY